MKLKPSITELINLLDKPALLKWSNKIGLQGIKLEEYRSESRQKGTNKHKEVEEFIKSGICQTDIQKKFKDLSRDWKNVRSEQFIETDFYTGKYDIYFEWNNIKYIADFKSSLGIYYENVLQLVAYSLAVKCDKMAIIELDTLRLKEVILLANKAKFENMLKHLAAIHFLKSQTQYRWEAK
jgi:hypothetical protein